MKTLDFNKIVLKPSQIKEFRNIKEGNSDIKPYENMNDVEIAFNLTRNLINQICQTNFSQSGATLQDQHTFFKVMDKFDKFEPVIKIDDDKFTFIFNAFQDSKLPLSTYISPIATWLDEIKLQKE